jgi:two-component system response regulator
MNAEPHKRAILVVDDDEAEVELISMAIEELKLPYRIDVARNGMAALDYLNRCGKFAGRAPGAPVLVILDNKMPVMSGLDALGEIRRGGAFTSIPVVMFTASANDEDTTRAYAAGANSYVVKPMGARNFKDTVQAIVNYWTKTNAADNSAG